MVIIGEDVVLQLYVVRFGELVVIIACGIIFKDGGAMVEDVDISVVMDELDIVRIIRVVLIA